jgi:hypothetical protein
MGKANNHRSLLIRSEDAPKELSLGRFASKRMDTIGFFLVILLFSIPANFAKAQQSSTTSQPQGIPSTVAINASRRSYVGDEACRTCHAEKVESYFHTAHHMTSRLPTKDSIAGSFAEGENILKTSNPGLYFRMESRPEGFYQTSIWEISPVSSAHSERMDVVIGSGRKGQTYLYWKGRRLFELPVSYWVELASWVNSPGYRDGLADFDRPVIPRCIECHATYAEIVAGAPPNQYKPTTLVVGISCERCHGPARAHVEAMAAMESARTIVSPAKLTRERQLEVCAQCHAGHGKPLVAAFSYLPGEPLDKFLQRDRPNPDSPVDVHGNQVALLQMSRCFQASPEMSCSTCHDVHTIQRGAAAYSSYCLKCHQPENCGEFPKLGEKIAGNCIDCHMPVETSNLIISDFKGKPTKAKVRNHWIKVYPETRTP